MSLSFYIKTFVFVMLNEQTKTFSMFIKKYLMLNTNTAKRRKNFV